jgi:hypothetical protein
MSDVNKLPAGIVTLTDGHPKRDGSSIIVTIDFGDGTQMVYDWSAWETWQRERLNNMVTTNDAARDALQERDASGEKQH